MTIKIDDVVKKYVELRDNLDNERKNFKAFEADSKEKMAKLEMWLLDKARDTGVESFKTNHGTAFRTTKDYARVAGPDGWDSLCAYILKTEDFGLVEKRVAKLHFKELLANGKVVPEEIGIEYVKEQVIQVRRS